MKVSALRKVLDKYDDNDFVHISIEGSREYFYIDKVEETILGKPILTAEEAPSFESLEGIAKACYEEHKDSLTELQISALENFGEVAEMIRQRESE